MFRKEEKNNIQYSYIHNDMVDNFIAIHLTFAEIFVPQDYTIMLLLGSVEPQTHVVCAYI